MKKLLSLVMILSFIFSSYAQTYNIDDLEEDNFQYIIEKDLWDFPLSALKNGKITGDPEKVKQYQLKPGQTFISFQTNTHSLGEIYEFEFHGVGKVCHEATQFTPYFCLTEPNKYFGTEKYESIPGKGVGSISVSDYIEQGATHVIMNVHYIYDEPVQGPTRPDTDKDHFTQTGEVKLVDKPLGVYMCEGDNIMQLFQVTSDGETEERLYTTCSGGCYEKEDGNVNCKLDEEREKLVLSPEDQDSINEHSSTDEDIVQFQDDLIESNSIDYVKITDIEEVSALGTCSKGYERVTWNNREICAKASDFDDTTSTSTSSLALLSVLALSSLGYYKRKEIARYLK